VPVWLLAAIFIALLILTWVTTAATQFDFGPTMNLTIAVAIATVKATLVVLFFMHLLWDRPINSIVFVSSILFVAIFIYFTLLDRGNYQPNVLQYRQENVLNLENPYAPEMPARSAE
jgi:cytochrome c oxidase subunit 4